MKVTSKNLLNVCKLLFALSKDESNDATFNKENISAPLVELLLSADPLVDCDTVVYGLGTVKLLASNSELREQLVGAEVMKLMANTLLKSTEQASQEENMKTRVRNILIQVQCTCSMLKQMHTHTHTKHILAVHTMTASHSKFSETCSIPFLPVITG